MKKIKTILTTLSAFGILSLTFTPIALADLLPLGSTGKRDTSGSPYINPNPESTTFIDLIEPQHIMIGGAVLAAVTISFIVLFKIRNK